MAAIAAVCAAWAHRATAIATCAMDLVVSSSLFLGDRSPRKRLDETTRSIAQVAIAVARCAQAAQTAAIAAMERAWRRNPMAAYGSVVSGAR